MLGGSRDVKLADSSFCRERQASDISTYEAAIVAHVSL